jgi:deoxycytidine triphosphate deaminase
MILSYQEIDNLCKSVQLIDDPEPKNIRSASYDLRLGNDCYIPSKKTLLSDRKWKEKSIYVLSEKDSFISVPANSFIIFMSHEKIKLPANTVGHLSLKLDLLLEGLIMSNQSQLDAGYEGKIVVLLYNLSSVKVKLKYHQSVVRLEFAKLSSDSQKPYSGSYQSATTLDTFITQPVSSTSLSAIDEKVNKIQLGASVATFIGSAIVIITYIISYFGPINDRVSELKARMNEFDKLNSKVEELKGAKILLEEKTKNLENKIEKLENRNK